MHSVASSPVHVWQSRVEGMDEVEEPGGAYRRAITAWVAYDWASAAFAALVVTAVLPLWFAIGAGAALPSDARATQLLAVVGVGTFVVVAIAAPVVGTWVDLVGRRRRGLAVAVGVGAAAALGLWFATTGNWILALVLVGVARIAASMGSMLHDSLLRDVTDPEDRAAISAGGEAAAGLGGGLLVALSLALVVLLPSGVGARWSFVLVAVWWVAFSIPMLRRVREPAPAGAMLVGLRPRHVLRDVPTVVGRLARNTDLGRALLTWVLSDTAMNLVVAAVVLDAAGLGLGTRGLVLAILLVQLVAAPHALLFGHLATDGATGRGRAAVFLVASIVLAPVAGMGLGLAGPADLVGRSAQPYQAVGDRVGQGEVDLSMRAGDGVRPTQLDPRLLAADELVPAIVVERALAIDYVGRDVQVTHAVEPGAGRLRVLVDGQPARDSQGQVLEIDADEAVPRYDRVVTASVDRAGPHRVTVVTDRAPVTVTGVEVLSPPRDSSWLVIAGAVLAVPLVALALSRLFGGMVAGAAARFDTRRALVVAVAGHVVVAAWAFRVDTVVEAWLLVWLVAVVQGGARGLARALYADLVPRGRSAQFMGVAVSLATLAAVTLPLLFGISRSVFGSPRPALVVLAGLFGLALALLLGIGWPPAVVTAPSGVRSEA